MASAKLSDAEFRKLLREGHQDPKFRRDIRKFIKITTGAYNLKDYGMGN